MAKEPTVSTKQEAFLGEAIVGTDHSRTDIYDGTDAVIGRGSDADESRSDALDNWAAKKAAE